MRKILFLGIFSAWLLTGCDIQEELDELTDKDSNSQPTQSTPGTDEDLNYSSPDDQRCLECDEFTLTAIAPDDYPTSILQNGANPFVGSSEEFIVIPGFLAGAEYIQTTDIQQSDSSNALIFSVLSNSAGYLAVDSGYSDSADWLEGWASTPHEISSSDRTFKIFARSLTAGHAVSTGQWPIVDSHPANYVVMAVPGAALNLGAVADDLPVVDQPDSGDQVEADEPVEDDPVSQDPVVDAPDDSSDSDEPIDNTPDEADSEQPASNEELITPPNYQWSVLDTDRNVYVDRTYVYSEIPMGYVGFTSLMTANSDKISNNSSQIIFSVNRAVRVYVGVDSRRANAPSWLASWTDSDTQVETTDSIMDIYYRDYSSGLVVLGGNEGSVSGSNYIVFLGDKNSDSQTDDPADMQPVAVNDFVNVEAGGEAVVSVLANDREILDGPISVSLASQPRHGEVELVGSQFIYTADNDYDGADTFDYQLIDVDGDRSIATVILDVTCTDCVEKSVQINLSWNASSGRPDSYEVFVGASDDGLVNVSVPFKVVPESITSLSFDANEVAPQILSDRLCFRLRARNRGGVSDFSDAACVNL